MIITKKEIEAYSDKHRIEMVWKLLEVSRDILSQTLEKSNYLNEKEYEEFEDYAKRINFIYEDLHETYVNLCDKYLKEL